MRSSPELILGRPILVWPVPEDIEIGHWLSGEGCEVWAEVGLSKSLHDDEVPPIPYPREGCALKGLGVYILLPPPEVDIVLIGLIGDEGLSAWGLYGVYS